MSKLHIKKGDIVFVNAGEDKGKTGRVLQVLVKDNRAIVEGINVVSKHTKPNAKNPQGGIEKRKLLFIFLTLTWLTRNLVKLHVSTVS